MPAHLSLALVAFAAFQTSTAVDVPKTGTTVPMLDVGGRPMVEVRINGKDLYTFILDTGASHTALDVDLATEIGVTDGGTGGRVRLDELRVGEAVIHGVDAGRIGGGMLRGLGPNPPRGVLSAAAFPGQLVILDYVSKRVTITPGELPAADNHRVFEYPASERLPVVPIRVAGHEYHIHLDSGSPGGVMLPMKSIADLPLTAPPVDVGQARTVAGTFPVQSATVNGKVEIGDYVLDLKEIRFSDLRPGPLPGPGNIGAQALRGFVVTFDSKNRRVKFERS